MQYQAKLWAQKWLHSFLCPCCSAGCAWRSSKHPSSVLCVTGSWTFLPTTRSHVLAGGIAPNATTWYAMWGCVWLLRLGGGQNRRSQVCFGLARRRVSSARMAARRWEAHGDQRLVAQQIFTFLVGTLAALPPLTLRSPAGFVLICWSRQRLMVCLASVLTSTLRTRS